jgi:hypothetical protein
VTRYGMIIAGQYAHGLPEFGSHEEAEKALFAQRDTGLQELQALNGLAANLDYSPESLKTLERWFFENEQPATTASGYSMPHAIGFYFGEVLCRTLQFRWVVQELVFAKGRYEIGVQGPLLAIMLTKGRQLRAAGNKRMQSLWREYQRYST